MNPKLRWRPERLNSGVSARITEITINNEPWEVFVLVPREILSGDSEIDLKFCLTVSDEPGINYALYVFPSRIHHATVVDTRDSLIDGGGIVTYSGADWHLEQLYYNFVDTDLDKQAEQLVKSLVNQAILLICKDKSES
jgi:hypothetical protein